MHGEDDQIVPVNISARKSQRIVKNVQAIYYPARRTGSP
jgi:non-heme chloroperoxidase